MFKVVYKSSNASQAWSSYGAYGNESSALAAAERIADRFLATRVIDPHGMTIWSA